ncbi:hypothetical protein BKG76_00255 [Mycobacteroides franklinii]|uniref:Uncharacterized protein n=1 Tax=Mycobacteroides franklinii TaxID=948102 RepID=A0A1S1LGR3_9MYCO|nr:hypothetical protein [Mycobacteroides franklinii]OHU31685.1 hypothetical protein BKG76_00255 [Mycobacteroides franklinii]
MDPLLRFWWAFELFSPQNVPDVGADVAAWRPGGQLPWSRPRPLAEGMQWEYTIYVGVYKTDKIYEHLNEVFLANEDEEVFASTRSGQTACAAYLVDHNGHLVEDVAELSSAAWALGKITVNPPPQPRALAALLDGFGDVNRDFADALAAAVRRADPQGKRPALSCQVIEQITQLVHQFVAGAGPAVATGEIRVKRARVKERADPNERPKFDFLNSSYLRELQAVRTAIARGEAGRALLQYLTPDDHIRLEERRDIFNDPAAIDEMVARTGVDRMPLGRWPSNPAQSLALSQQFAADEALATLGPMSGLMGVNGPPGTGKSTLLREIVAANVVERAVQLARLPHPDRAFGDLLATWKTEQGYERAIPQILPELTGFEMVVASSNNGAVENISNELPAKKQLDARWRERAGYFKATANDVLRAADPCLDEHSGAWGMISARLGKRANRDTFVRAFWLGTANPADRPAIPLRMALSNAAERTTTWAEAIETFHAALRVVEQLREPRLAAQRRIEAHHALREDLDAKRAVIDDLYAQAGKLAEQRTTCRGYAKNATEHAAALEAEIAEHGLDKPRWWRGLKTWWRTRAGWAESDEQLRGQRDDAVYAAQWYSGEDIRLYPIHCQALETRAQNMKRGCRCIPSWPSCGPRWPAIPCCRGIPGCRAASSGSPRRRVRRGLMKI